MVMAKGEEEAHLENVALREARRGDIVSEAGGIVYMLLPDSGVKETEVLLGRMEKTILATCHSFTVLTKALVFPVTRSASFEEVQREGLRVLPQLPSCPGMKPMISEVFQSAEKASGRLSVIEPDPLTREMLKGYSMKVCPEDIEMDVQVFPDTKSFLLSQSLKEPKPHAVLLHASGEGPGALEVIHYLRSLPGGSRYYIILSAAPHSEEEVSRAYAAGVDDHMFRPLHLELLSAKVFRRFRKEGGVGV
ncbi:hypothetical protein [Alkalicoccus urumqiensis]|nr:hypothetical protein [Alkalicoccus urumqiensis]